MKKIKSSGGSNYEQVECFMNLGTNARSVISTPGSSALLDQTSLGFFTEDESLYCIFVNDKLTFAWGSWKDRS